MFFILSKLLLFLISPLTWIILFCIVALFSKNTLSQKKYLKAALLFSIFFSNTFIFDRFMNAWEIKAIPDDKISKFDAAIVLTGMVTYDSKIKRLEFNDRTDRLMQAIQLYKENKVDKIILCGGPATMSGDDIMEAPVLKLYLEKMGIPGYDILLESKSRNTHENAVNMKLMLDQTFPGGKYLLISSGWHLRRATACFIKEGIKIMPYSTDRYSGPIKFDIDYLLIPSSETLFNWEKLTHEWVGTICYFLMGWE
jgi:uncharacterized SAM-binding protein YcdF (DUF218 family)